MAILFYLNAGIMVMSHLSSSFMMRNLRLSDLVVGWKGKKAGRGSVRDLCNNFKQLNLWPGLEMELRDILQGRIVRIFLDGLTLLI